MSRSTALLTVLLAFAIFAIPTSAAPPDPHVIPVEVVNQATDPVKVCDVNVEVCKKNHFVKRIKEPLRSGINRFEIFNDRDSLNNTLVIETASFEAHIGAGGRITRCAIGTKILNADWELLFALPIDALNHAPDLGETIVWSGTSMVHVVLPYTDQRYVIEVIIGLEPPAFMDGALVEFTVSGYIVDSACPTP